MPVLSVVLDLERDGFRAVRGNAQDMLEAGALVHLRDDRSIEVGALPAGMASGAPSAMLCFALPDGRAVIAETSLALLLTAADALKARHGDPRDSTPPDPTTAQEPRDAVTEQERVAMAIEMYAAWLVVEDDPELSERATGKRFDSATVAAVTGLEGAVVRAAMRNLGCAL